MKYVINVLILVVMEYTQWDVKEGTEYRNPWVLILVVMEYTQWGACSLLKIGAGGS